MTDSKQDGELALIDNRRTVLQEARVDLLHYDTQDKERQEL